MDICSADNYTPLKSALKEVGFKIEKIAKQGKKTIITVSRNRKKFVGLPEKR